MTDPNMSSFYGRVARIQKMRAKGYGFEAPGTLGRSYYYRPAPQRRSIMMPMIFVVMLLFALKGVIFQQVGAETYNQRVAGLMAGEGVEKVGGWLMQSDPVTLWVAGKVEALLHKAE